MSKKRKKIPVEPLKDNESVSKNSAESQAAREPAAPAFEANDQSQESAVKTPRAEIEELTQRLQRLGADYQNFQKRALKKEEQAAQFAREDLVRTLLPVLDNFCHALEKSDDTCDANAVLQGMQIVYDHFMQVLTGAGLKPIKISPGDSFDPALHEAMLHEENAEFPVNTIVRELARGYIMNERTLRPAKVSVAKTPAPKEPDKNESSGSGAGEGNTETRNQ
ncbi:MAG: nucleotide exchange factor GrpE [Sedimentisphaerales bacterium]|nr:nucleotide exchange factor GrpE [Sedimentisphaerales bacterium]